MGFIIAGIALLTLLTVRRLIAWAESVHTRQPSVPMQ